MAKAVDTQEAADTDAIATIAVIVVHVAAHPPRNQLVNVEYMVSKTLSNAYLDRLMGFNYTAVAITVKGCRYLPIKTSHRNELVGYALISAKDANCIAGRYWRNKEVRAKIQDLLAGVVERSFV